MCRLLFVRSESEFDLQPYLENFAAISKSCKVEQTDGWGCSIYRAGEWRHYKTATTFWEDDLSKFGKAERVVAHCRSASEFEELGVEMNMPFYDENLTFAFNGKLAGTKIKAEGKVGGEKIFNFTKRFMKDDILKALKKSVDIIEKRSSYVKALNIIMADKEKVYVTNYYNEQPDYYSLYRKEEDGTLAICSKPFPNEGNWEVFENKFIGEFE